MTIGRLLGITSNYLTTKGRQHSGWKTNDKSKNKAELPVLNRHEIVVID
ncbi:MAG: hypothetical protein JO297_11785 [Nitrososphaeraceae archaeon]|nr:hypothetical protein [Nitrososphaeraceae archaeon]